MRTSVKALLASSLVAVSCIAVATPAFADDTAPPSDITITGAATVASQYRFRGVAQSDNKPVIQGTFTIAHSSGFYISTWGSSASGGASPIQIGGTEIDVYGGYTHGLGESGFTVDAGVYGYLYPGFTPGNYYELYASLAKTVGPVTAKGGFYFAPAQKVFNLNFTSTSRKNMYIYGELGGSIPNTPLSIHSHLGHSAGGFNYPKDFFDYNVGITAKYKNLALDASIVGTTAKRSQFISSSLCSGVAACAEPFYRTTKPVGVVSLTASF